MKFKPFELYNRIENQQPAVEKASLWPCSDKGFWVNSSSHVIPSLLRSFIIISFLTLFGIFSSYAQVLLETAADYGFDEAAVIQEYQQKEAAGLIEPGVLEEYIADKKYHYLLHNGVHQPQIIPSDPATTAAPPCTNVDFETGDFTGWSGSTGCAPTAWWDHPQGGAHWGGPCGGDTNGCCPNTGFITNGVNAHWKDYDARFTITTGNGVDSCGFFPVVAPAVPGFAQGQYSLRLGNGRVGQQADRIQQTFTVGPGNTNFVYQYAVVLNDPGTGHAYEEKPYFEILMTFASGPNIGDTVPCTYYHIVAGDTTDSDFQEAQCQGNFNTKAYYKDWTTVQTDLAQFSGLDINISFTTVDCGQGGHWGYAYFDCTCYPSQITNYDTICAGETTTLTAPDGFTDYLWTTGETTKSIEVDAAGDYSVTASNTQGCGSVYDWEVYVYPNPVANFSSGAVCLDNPTVFTNASSVASGSIVSCEWDFGDGNTSTDCDPTHVYTAPGSYNVTLTVTTDGGCQNTFTDPVSVNPFPTAAFTGVDVCIGLETCFTDASQLNGAARLLYDWDLGQGTATDQNPCITYTAPGTYDVTLTVTSESGCADTETIQVEVYPNPTANFSVSPQPATVFDTKITFTDLSQGADSGTWDFGDAGADTIYIPGMNPTHVYPNDNTSGSATYRVTLDVINQYGCPDVIQKPVVIDPYWTFYIPDAFTPNNDLINDTFFGKGVGIVEYEMWIYDRWGNKIFHCDVDDLPQHPLCHWDGKVQNGPSGVIAQQDVYVWLVLFKDIFGDKHRRIGHVSMVR